MTIRYITALIRVDEELLDCDFAHPAASIEEAVAAWEGCKVVRWDDPAPESESCVRSIAGILWKNGHDTQWDSDTACDIADAVRSARPELVPPENE